MIAALALTAAGAALIGAVEYARIRLVRARFARAVHAQRRAVPPGMAPPSHPAAGAVVVGAQFGPVGVRCLGTPRPGHLGGDAA